MAHCCRTIWNRPNKGQSLVNEILSPHPSPFVCQCLRDDPEKLLKGSPTEQTRESSGPSRRVLSAQNLAGKGWHKEFSSVLGRALSCSCLGLGQQPTAGGALARTGPFLQKEIRGARGAQLFRDNCWCLTHRTVEDLSILPEGGQLRVPGKESEGVAGPWLR